MGERPVYCSWGTHPFFSQQGNRKPEVHTLIRRHYKRFRLVYLNFSKDILFFKDDGVTFTDRDRSKCVKETASVIQKHF